MIHLDFPKLILIGRGGHARSVADVAIDANPSLQLLFVEDSGILDELILGFPTANHCEFNNQPIHIAFGDNSRRAEVFQNYSTATLFSIVSRRSYLGRGATLGLNCFLAHGCHVGPATQIGDGVIVNTGAVLEHEVKVGNFCHIGPNTTISGRTQLGNHVFLGVGATIIDGLTLCNNVIVGAGATVVTNICEPGTYVGIPARKLPTNAT